VQRRLKPGCSIDEKQTVGDVVFLDEFLRELFHKDGRSGGKEPHVQELAGLGSNSGAQPIVLGVELNHGLVDYDVIRVFPVVGL